QIKNQIISGALAPGDNLPSIRSLAKDLEVSVITTKRAYDDLSAEGFIKILAGRGSFVLPQNSDLIRDNKLKSIESLLREAVNLSKIYDIDNQTLREILEILLEEENA
ncbi:MAG: GntR family transcriptional regulator, partial [Tissierellia bacterium]|nr:GntR family transcriptional regulator [Tissierellia bacterium]